MNLLPSAWLQPHRKVPEYSPQEWQEVAETVSLDQPFVIRGICRSWPVFEVLTFDYLREKKGDIGVPVVRSYSEPKRQMRLADFLDYCLTTDDPEPLYLSSWAYQTELPEIRAMADPPAVFRSWLEMAVPGSRHPIGNWLFVGPAGSGTQLHVDGFGTSAWNAVLSGSKEWMFLPADLAISLELRQSRHTSRALNVEDGEPWMTVQDAGDLVFTPSGWGHAVLNRSAGIAIAENFVNERNYQTVLRHLHECPEQESRFQTTVKNLRIVNAFRH